LISDRYKVIFIHIPKTGGTSVEAILWPNPKESELFGGVADGHMNKYTTGGLQHLPARFVRDEVGVQKFFSYLKFSIVRNPYSKAISQFSYMSIRPDLRELIGMDAEDSFDRYLELIQMRQHVQWDKQALFVQDERGVVVVDKVLRFEDFSQGVRSILNELRVPISVIPHLNKNPCSKALKPAQISKYAQRMIEEIYREDFEYFSY
jgi:hypothetical protein